MVRALAPMKTVISRLSLIILLFTLAQTAPAQQAKSAQSAGPDASALKRHVTHLASDELDARKPI